MRVFVLGGTRGMGLALAQHYLAAGHTVAVSGRSLARLVEVKFIGDAARLHQFEFDLLDDTALCAAIDAFAKDGLDLLIVCAGKYIDSRHQALSAFEAQEIISTNVGGVVRAFDAALKHMLPSSTGHLVAFASVAGLFKADRDSSIYSSSKRAVLQVCETYARSFASHGIAVTAIVPGYVNTARLRELNAGNAGTKPFLISEAAAVCYITTAIKKRAARVIFPWQMHVVARLLNVLPASIRQWILARRR